MQAKILFLVVFGVLACVFAAEEPAGGAPSPASASAIPSAVRSNPGYFNRPAYQGRDYQGRGGYYGRNRQGYGPDEYRRYRTNLYGDDDVYGYDATYPNGEAAYVNYRSKDARARRGPEFERISRAYTRQGEGYPGSTFGQSVFKSAFGQPQA